MSISIHNLKFTDAKELSVDLEFIIACNRVSGNELIKIVLENEDMKDKFRSSASRLLKSIFVILLFLPPLEQSFW